MKKISLKKIIKWISKIFGYTLILMTVAVIFKKSIYIDASFYGFWCVLISLIIFLLNKTVKPLLFWLTLPITGLTLGLFYPCINMVILYFVSLIMGNHFNITGNILIIFLIAVLISLMNFVMNEIINWLFRKEN